MPGSCNVFTILRTKKEGKIRFLINFLRRTKRKIKVFFVYIKWLFTDHSAYWGDHDTGIPLEDMDALVRVLYPDVIEFFSTPEGKQQYMEWKTKKEAVEKMKLVEIKQLKKMAK